MPSGVGASGAGGTAGNYSLTRVRNRLVTVDYVTSDLPRAVRLALQDAEICATHLSPVATSLRSKNVRVGAALEGPITGHLKLIATGGLLDVQWRENTFK